jgi:hypothetical protein
MQHSSMNLLKKVKLNNESIAYINNWLDNAHVLSPLVLKNIDLDKGEIYTYVPEYVNDEKLYAFNDGIYKRHEEDQTIEYKLPSGKIGVIHKKGKVANACYWLIEDIKKDFDMGISNTGLFEDPVAGPELLEYHDYDFANAYKNTLYWNINKNMDSKTLFEIINAISNFSPPLIGYLYKDHSPNNKLDLSGEYLLSVSKKINKIIVGAYDSEGFIIWENKS